MALYLKYLSIEIKSQLSHRASFVFTTIGQFIMSFTIALSMYFMFDRFHTVAGFNFSEALLCFAVVLLAFSFSECFVRGFDIFPVYISNGSFDRMLTRPRNVVFQVLVQRIELTRIGRLALAAILFVYAVPRCGIIWSPDKILLLAFMVTGGVVYFSAMFMVGAAVCFFTIESIEVINIFTDGGREIGKYPMGIYGDGVLKFFTYLAPLACFQYYPLLYLLGRSDSLVYYFAPAATFVLLFLAILFWKYGLKHYKSTGS